MLSQGFDSETRSKNRVSSTVHNQHDSMKISSVISIEDANAGTPPANVPQITESHCNEVSTQSNEIQSSVRHTQSAHPDSIFDPPITAAMLKELDNEVLNANVQIRHDLILEPQLKLRPNSHRRTNATYQHNYRHYWTAMELEIESFIAYGSIPRRLLRALEEMKKLIIVCYPNSQSVIEGTSQFFDVDLLRHQVLNRSLSLVPLMQSIAEVLKLNCAPKRDVLVDHLVELARYGKYAVMIREFFEIMELMKLDLANYHLVHLKESSIGTIVTMEREYFNRELSRGNKNIEATKNWILSGDLSLSPFDCFKRKTAMTLLDPTSELPETFHLDLSRTRNIRNDIQLYSIAASITCGVRQVCGKTLNNDAMEELKSRLSVLISSSETNIEDIAKNTIIVLEHVHAPKAIIEACPDFVNKIIRPDSPLFVTVQQRIHEIIARGVISDSDPIADARERKVSCWSFELSQTVTKMLSIIRHHWTVYYPLYEAILLGQN